MAITKKSTQFQIITKVMYQFISKVQSIETGSTSFTRVVTFITGYDWLNIPFAPGTASFTEPELKSSHGSLFNQLLKLRFPGDTSDSIADLEKLDILPVVIKLTMADGVQKLIGSTDNPAMHLSNFNQDKDLVADEFSFTCQARHRAYVLEVVA